MTQHQEQPAPALDRLSPEQRAQLDNVAASFELEHMRPTAAEQEILAAYVLGEITAEECDARMDALG